MKVKDVIDKLKSFPEDCDLVGGDVAGEQCGITIFLVPEVLGENGKPTVYITLD